MADESSRLSNGFIFYNGQNIPIKEYRDMIFARSLYALQNEYKNTNRVSLRNKGEVASGIASVLATIPQYNRIQTSTNLFTNGIDAFSQDIANPNVRPEDYTSLSRIGVEMLGKHMAYNSAMNLSIKYLPSINVSEALKGGKLFSLNKDNTITVEDKDAQTFGDRISNFGSNILGIDTYDVFGNANPFNKTSTNIERIKNTGDAQLTRFFTAINLNIYKQVNGIDNSNFTTDFLQYGNKLIEGGVKDRKNIPKIRDKSFFNFLSTEFNPYNTTGFDVTAIEDANQDMWFSYVRSTNAVQEYAPNIKYIIDNFGMVSLKPNKDSLIRFVGTESNFRKDTADNKLVWGRDGTNQETRAYVGNLRGDDDKMSNPATDRTTIDYNINEGLLRYTKNLLNASSGRFIDITRKAFEDGDKNVVGFQGSGLWKSNNSTYAQGSNNSDGSTGKKGIRQHTVLDPYNRFAKSIRFKGNEIYNGTSDSVIAKRVTPRIHPTYKSDGTTIDNKNLMFSLENLAVGTIKREKYGVIDDEYGTPIPLSEVGPFAGRQMWFPPYNIQLNEVAIAKYDVTVMIGRNEPMYNYMNSERTAVMSFMLLIDYPEQLRNIDYQGKNKNKIIADFFAFGGDPLPTEIQIEIIEKKIKDLEEQKPQITVPEDQKEVEGEDTEIFAYFMNNRPTVGADIYTIFNTMYNNPHHYEVIEGLESDTDGNGFGYNNLIYSLEGLSGNSDGTTYKIDGGPYDQYGIDSINLISEDGSFNYLNKNLLDVFQDENNRKYYNIEIVGSASLLYLSDNQKAYNDALSKRRVAAVKELILTRMIAMFGAAFVNEFEARGQFVTGFTGSDNATPEGADPDNIHNRAVKEDRSVSIKVKRNSINIPLKKQPTTSKEQQNLEKIQSDIQELNVQLKRQTKNIKENVFAERYDDDDAVLEGFEAVMENKYVPAFHSQTPEDFHRRLTFLQQCTRQGAAKRYDIIDEDDGSIRPRNSVFGRQPICVLRIGDFFHTKIIIESVTIDYADTTWDLNPEGFGLQPMIANVTLQMKIIGGQSLKGPIDALQNAVTFNYYANSSFTDRGVYARASKEATKQVQYMNGVLTEKKSALNSAYENNFEKIVREGEE